MPSLIIYVCFTAIMIRIFCSIVIQSQLVRIKFHSLWRFYDTIHFALFSIILMYFVRFRNVGKIGRIYILPRMVLFILFQTVYKINIGLSDGCSEDLKSLYCSVS